MHLAQFVHRYPPARGGAEAYIARLTDYLRANGDTVDVWTTSAIALEEFWHGGAAATTIEPSIRRYRPFSFPLRRYVLKALTFLPTPRLRSFVLPCNPISIRMWHDAGNYDGPLDAVHATAFPYAWPILCARRLARKRGVPFLLTPFLHLGDARTRRQYTQPALRWLLLDADRVFVQTRLERDAAIALGVKKERVVLQGLGVDPAECTGGNRIAFRARHGIAKDEIVIGHLANLSVEKGSVDLLEAAKNLNCRVVLAGSTMPNFRRYWEQYPGKNRVTLLGSITESEKRDFYAGIDVFALPSRSDSFGLVLLEAWANHKPCVAYRAGGPGELIEHGKDGLLAVCGDVQDLQQQLRNILDDSAWMGQSGLNRIAEFDWPAKLEYFRLAATRSLRSGARGPFLRAPLRRLRVAANQSLLAQTR